MKRLIKAEVYDVFNISESCFEIFKNPNAHEIESLKKCPGGIRGVIEKSGDKYIWSGNCLHNSVNSYIKNNKIDLNYFTFTSDNSMWYSHLRGKINCEECKKVIKNNLDFFQQVGDLNRKFELTTDEGDFKFDSLIEFIKDEKEITGKIYSGFYKNEKYFSFL